MPTFKVHCTVAYAALAGLLMVLMSPTLSPAEDQRPSSKKPAVVPKYRTAEIVAKAHTCEGIAPQIHKLVPDEGKPGSKVTITGLQFGSPECLRSVSFGPGHVATFSMSNEATIVTTVPSNNRKGLVILTVTTASGEDSKPFLVK